MLIHLAAVADLAVADHSSPYGVLPRVASRGSQRKRLPLHVWLNPEGLGMLISIEHKAGLFPRRKFWSGGEFGQWGIDVQELWTSAVSHLASSVDRLTPTDRN